jgi:hypothetical protein
MKNEVSKKIIRHRIVPLITLMFLSSSTAVLAESPPKGNVNTQFSGQQVIENKAPQQKNIGAITSTATLNGQNPSSKAPPPLVRSSTVRSLISQFESFATQTMDAVKTTILPKTVGGTQQSVRRRGVNPTETEKQGPAAATSPQGTTLSIEAPTSRVAEAMGSILVSKPFVDQIIEGEGSLQVPSPVIGTPTIVSDPAAIQGASDAVDALANAVKQTTAVEDELRVTEQAITDLSAQTKTIVEQGEIENTQQAVANLVAQKKTLEEEYLQGEEKQNALVSNISQPQQNTANPETLLDILKQSLMARRAVVKEDEEVARKPLQAYINPTPSTLVKKTDDELIIDNLAAIEAAKVRIATLKPTAELPLETGFTKQSQRHNFMRNQALKEIKKLNDEINIYSKNNETLMSQKKTREEEIASKQQKVQGQLKAKATQPVARESFLESIRNRAKKPVKESTEMTVNIPQKQEVRSGGMRSLGEKIEEFKQRLPLSSYPMGDDDNDDEWDD